MKPNKRSLVLLTIIGMFFLYTRCVNSSKQEPDVRGDAYAGSSTCITCHKDVAANYQHNKHFQTSWAASSRSEKITPDTNGFTFNDSTIVKVEKRDSTMFQVLYENRKETMAKPFDIGFGSGEKAYSFGYWQNKKLYQLPLSYFTQINGWANSPGFPAHRANFQRPIIRQCFECHSSYIGEETGQAESLTQQRQLDKNSIIYGIDCERCHGAAAEHVKFQTDNPSVKDARYITSFTKLSRQQKLDACGVCHSGNDLTTLMSTFAFQPGDTLSKFYYPEFGSGPSRTPDVHGRQVQLLSASLCFRKSDKLECSSCHNTHPADVNKLVDYSKQCISCHQQTAHKDPAIESALSKTMITNCIDCHMPKEASRLISFQMMAKEKVDSYLLRTHRIAVYPSETQKIMERLKQSR